MKLPTACQQCRSTKRKCTDDSKGESCVQCRSRNLICSKTERPRKYPRLASLASGSKDVSEVQREGSISDADITELVKNYLYFIHGRPHSLFHEQTLWNDIKSGTINKSLLYSICSLGSPFSLDPRLRDLGSPLTAESKRLLQSELENISLQNIQTCILLANICAASSETTSEILYFGIGNRMAQILRLHRTNRLEKPIIREVKSRVWWTLIMADYWCSAGLGLPRQLHHEKGTVDLPADELVFESLSGHSASANLETPGLWAHMIELVEIFGLVQDLNRRLVNGEHDEEAIEEKVHELSRQLDTWNSALPANRQLNGDNLERHRKEGLGGPFVALHLGYHHYSVLLYFQYLDQQHPLAKGAAVYGDRCKLHAMAYSRLLKDSREKRGCEAVYATVGQMTVVSSAVLLHTLLFGRGGELVDARIHLESNFMALLELKRYWPSLERTISRLFTFQNTCLSSVDANTHKIDRWMVRFLLEHAMPLDERMVGDEDEVVDAKLHDLVSRRPILRALGDTA